jgi:hypothetical protein
MLTYATYADEMAISAELGRIKLKAVKKKINAALTLVRAGSGEREREREREGSSLRSGLAGFPKDSL